MITLTTEQAQQIEEALEDIVRVFKFENGTPVEALAVIRAARANFQSETSIENNPADSFKAQAPVAWMSPGKERLEFSTKSTVYGSHTIPLYAAPVRTKDLTDDELLNELKMLDASTARLPIGFKLFARAVIKADRELNK